MSYQIKKMEVHGWFNSVQSSFQWK
jgi:hypothetical protein